MYTIIKSHLYIYYPLFLMNLMIITIIALVIVVFYSIFRNLFNVFSSSTDIIAVKKLREAKLY